MIDTTPIPSTAPTPDPTSVPTHQPEPTAFNSPVPSPEPTGTVTPTPAPENMTVDMELPSSASWGGTSHWIPNTGAIFGPFKTKITFKNSPPGSLLTNDSVFLDILPPLDDSFSANETGTSNIRKNQGTCQYVFYGLYKNNKSPKVLKIFKLNSSIVNSADRYKTVYSESGGSVIIGKDGYVYHDYDDDFSMVKEMTFGIGIREDTGTIRPGDDLRFRFGLLYYPEYKATASEGDFVAVYDYKLLWRANLYIDEGVNDWNNVNPWNDPAENDWYVSQVDGVDVNGGQINIASWTRFDDHTGPDAELTELDNGEVYGAVAYSWAGTDTPFDFNADMEDQRLAIRAWYSSINPYWNQNVNPHPEWANYNNTISPNGLWSGYIFGMYGNDDSQPGKLTFSSPNRYPYTPGYRTKRQFVDEADTAIDTTYSAGLDCTGFIHKSASYKGNPYTLSDLSNTRVTWGGTVQGQAGGTIYSNYCWPVYDTEQNTDNMDLIIPGDIVSIPSKNHGAMVLSISYTGNDRIIKAMNVKLIESAYARGKYMVVNDQNWNTSPYNGAGRLGRLITH